MSNSLPPAPPPSAPPPTLTMVRTGIARTRRLKAIALALLALALVTGLGLGAMKLAEASGARLDLTAAGEQQLAPRTLALFRTAREQSIGVRAIAVGPVSAVDPRVRREVLDVLDLFDAQPGSSVTVLDTASPNGAEGYQKLIEELSVEHAAELDTFAAGVVRGVESARQRSGWLTDSLSPRLADLAKSAPARAQAYTQAGAAARILARDLEALAGKADSAREALSPMTLADANDARIALAELLGSLAAQLETLSPVIASDPDGTKLAAAISAERDAAASSADALALISPPPVVRAARALERGEGVLLIAPGRVAAMAFEDVFVEWTNAARTDVRRAAEGAIASGLAAMLDDHRPLVVLMHGEFTPLLDRFRGFDGVLDRLASRGIDVIEWPAGRAEAPPPDIAAADPTGQRPVVYVTLAPDSSVRATGDNPATSGPARASAMGAKIADLLEQGERLLVSLNPSVLPAVGSTDPVVDALRRIGVSASTGTPLMSESFGPQGRMTAIDASGFASETDHPMARALRGLPTLFPWPVPVTADGAAIYELAAEGRWAEGEWGQLWRTPHSQRGLLLQQTQYDEERDTNTGPWTIATAIERDHDDGIQRALVVGSNGWFSDGVALGRGEIDGRSVLLYPGNVELLEAGVLWLAGRDAEVMPSAQARAVPLVRALDRSTFAWLRWGLILGLPIVVLIIGGVWRLIRG